MCNFDRLRSYLEDIFDWTLLERLKLRKVVIGFLTIQFVCTLSLLPILLCLVFTYVHRAGRVGFVHGKWVTHDDIFRYRRFQPWELTEPIDWAVDNRLEINQTRHILDKECSMYDSGIPVPGDPGDYLKEVAGHPNQRYNPSFKKLGKIFLLATAMLHFNCPILLLALWWKKQTNNLIGLYIAIELIPMFLMVYWAVLVGDHNLCAIDYIYGGVKYRLYFKLFILVMWCINIFKFLVLGLHCMEQTMARKRKEFGFRRRNFRPQRPPDGASVANNTNARVTIQVDEYYDAEKVLREEEAELKRTGKTLAREILELGGSTGDESENIAKRITLAEEGILDAEKKRAHLATPGGRRVGGHRKSNP